MKTPIPKLLRGTSDWSLPADWREVAPICARAVSLVLRIVENDELPRSQDEIADVVWAIRLIADTPPQMRPADMVRLTEVGKTVLREHQRASRRPMKAGRVLLGLATGGVSELAGVVARPVVRRVVEYAEERVLGDDGAQEIILQNTWERSLDALLDSFWSQERSIQSDPEFAKELGFLVAWRSISREWSGSLDGEPDENYFVRELEKLRAEFTEIKSSPAAMINLWVSSPFESPLSEHHKIQKKLEKGNLPPEILSVLQWYLETEETTLRHVREFATKMNWTSTATTTAGLQSGDTTISDGTW